MRVCVLSSGSKGNATYIETENAKILIDIGISYTKLENKLKQININPKEINCILISHIHSDHTQGLLNFSKKNLAPVYLTPEMANLLNINNSEIINFYEPQINIFDIKIDIFRTSHDVDDSFGFVITHQSKSVVYVTDTGYLNVKYFDQLKNKNLYIIESNHDVEMLMKGKYPNHLKQRILSDRGHLSNEDCNYYLSKLIGENTQNIILAHMSQDNNHPNLVLNAISKNSALKNINIHLAEQNQITELIEV